jgi:hypothetical protein
LQVDIMGNLILELEASATSMGTSGSRAVNIVTAELAPVVNGTMVLYSASYPGPGFTGTYDWNGTLKLEPDPFKRLEEMYQSIKAGASASSSDSASVGARKASRLLHGEQDSSQAEAVDAESRACASSDYPLQSGCNGGSSLQARHSSSSASELADVSSLSSSGNRRLQEVNDVLDAPVQGRITVREWYLKGSAQQGVSESAAFDPLITVAGGPICAQTGTCNITSEEDAKRAGFRLGLALFISIGVGAVAAAGLCIFAVVAGVKRRQRRERARREATQAAAAVAAAVGGAAGARSAVAAGDGALSSAVLPWSGSGAIESRRGSLELARGRRHAAGEGCKKRHILSSNGGGLWHEAST